MSEVKIYYSWEWERQKHHQIQDGSLGLTKILILEISNEAY